MPQQLSKDFGWQPRRTEKGMVIRSCDGNIAAFYVMKSDSMKIGRSQKNIIRSL